MKSQIKKAIQENTKDLLNHYKQGQISLTEIIELEQEAINDEEYEVAISIKEVINIIIAEKKLKNLC